MTIDEAIKYLTKELGNVRGLGMQVRIDAIRLGIEALKETKRYRELKVGFYADLLPGETEK